MAIMKAFIYWWGREDVLFASAVLPAAFMWVQYESTLIGILSFPLFYACVLALYEFAASKRGWPHSAAVNFVKELMRFYNPQ